MLYAFAFPLLLGVLPSFLLGLSRRNVPKPVRSLWNAALASLTVGSLVSGALEIFGTQSPLTAVYLVLGGGLILTALLTGLLCALVVSKKGAPAP